MKSKAKSLKVQSVDSYLRWLEDACYNNIHQFIKNNNMDMIKEMKDHLETKMQVSGMFRQEMLDKLVSGSYVVTKKWICPDSIRYRLCYVYA